MTGRYEYKSICYWILSDEIKKELESMIPWKYIDTILEHEYK